VLGTSKEYFGSDHFLIQVRRQILARRIGLMIHNTAGIINPGHFLHITFEITNQNNVPIIFVRPWKSPRSLFKLTSPSESELQKSRAASPKTTGKHFIPAKVNGKKRKLAPSKSMEQHPERSISIF